GKMESCSGRSTRAMRGLRYTTLASGHFVRHGAMSDWKFFLEDEDWLNLWGRRFGESAVDASHRTIACSNPSPRRTLSSVASSGCTYRGQRSGKSARLRLSRI